jgi:putative membrane protein
MARSASFRFHVSLLILVLAVFLWSSVRPFDRLTWAMEVAPVVVALVLLVGTYRRFVFTDLAYALIAFHGVVLVIGGQYTYERMPFFNWLRDTFELSRNHYDRLGHFVQGFVPAIVIRELLRRTAGISSGRWLFTIIVFGCLGVSSLYELIEWQAAAWLGSGADAFLATQGDPWDTQKDMALAGVGAILAQLCLSGTHERQLRGRMDG